MLNAEYKGLQNYLGQDTVPSLKPNQGVSKLLGRAVDHTVPNSGNGVGKTTATTAIWFILFKYILTLADHPSTNLSRLGPVNE